MVDEMMAAHASGDMTEPTLTSALLLAVDRADLDSALDKASAGEGGLVGKSGAAGGDEGGGGGGHDFLIAPAGQGVFRDVRPVFSDACAFQFLPGVLERGGL